MNDVHYKGMPKVVRVGCFWFRVKVGEWADHEATRTFGHMCVLDQTISVRPGMTPQKLANVFLHEVMHAIYFFVDAGRDEKMEDPEEEFVTKGANGLCAFFQDNPKACAWWQRTLNMEPKA